MKKYIALTLVLVFALLAFAGCGAKTAKTGMGVVTSIGSSKEPGEKDGNAQVDSIVAAVLVGADGKILNCKIDTAQTKIAFTAAGTIATALDAEIKSKQEKGPEYGMKGASPIGKEWNEQADALAAYVVGKTVDEVKAIPLNEEGAPTGADLVSSVTVHADGYIAAIVKAVENAKELGAKAGDTLGLGVTTTIGNSKDAAADAEGLAQAYSHYTATTFGKDGKITSCYIDASQTGVKFTAEGKITTDLASSFKTKNELGPEYNMKPASPIGKEWNEQAEAFAKYVTGKTVDEVKGMALTEGAPSGADIVSSVTIHVTDMIGVIAKAAANAK